MKCPFCDKESRSGSYYDDPMTQEFVFIVGHTDRSDPCVRKEEDGPGDSGPKEDGLIKTIAIQFERDFFKEYGAHQ